MSFLEEHWPLKPRVPGGQTLVAGASFLRPWVHENANMDTIVQAIAKLKPGVVLELGTCTGVGTEKIAKAMKKGKLYTFDVSHSPVNSLGPVYGCKDFEVEPIVDWRSFPKGHTATQGWHSWGEIEQYRIDLLERLKRELKKVKIVFVQGLTYDSLPKIMEKIGEFDFCFQDTLHTTPHIIQEWELYKGYAKVGSIVVFDDLAPHHNPQNQDFIEWFDKNEKDWIYRHNPEGNGLLWVEKVKGEDASESKHRVEKGRSKEKV